MVGLYGHCIAGYQRSSGGVRMGNWQPPNAPVLTTPNLPPVANEVFRLNQHDQRIIVGSGGNPDTVDLWADEINTFDFKQSVGLSVPGPRGTPVSVQGLPAIAGDGIETQYLTTQFLSAMLPGGAGQKFWGLIIVQMLVLGPARASDAGAFAEPALLGDLGLFLYITISVAGASTVMNVAGFKPTPPAVPISGTMLGFTSTSRVIEYGYDGASLICRVDSGVPTTRAMGVLPAGVGFPMALFGARSLPGGVPLANGILRFVNLVNDYPSLAVRTAARRYVSQVFGVTV